MWDMPRKVNPRNVHVVFVLHECTPELSKNAFVFNGNQFYKARVADFFKKEIVRECPFWSLTNALFFQY